MGHTLYYKTRIERWGELRAFLRRICRGLGYEVKEEDSTLTILPECPRVEPLSIPRRGFGFAKTNLVEPYHSLYLLILHSLCSFGSVEVWEDE
ncbi:hypothetical protein [Pyrococcus yayanosii]|uniref:Putative TonB-dependent receptor n=1 Tax=Pyrococcus yayanosii (strain CH1 / JCM 16557) TaxID=529709 RepID=F8AES1_PYRYC|nr:hypothetical protein [Pyrococcus yayanosii]AEH24753.1 Putative TonB-dependent receptor [Pyrococcus yayanosii CH1]